MSNTFPLFLHASGQWAKKIRGRTRYFGTEKAAALKKYRLERDDLQAGREPRLWQAGMPLEEMVNRYLTAKSRQRAAGELSSLAFGDYLTACERLVEFFGADRPAESLTPDDFDRYRAALAETKGASSLSNAITRIRMAFKWAYENELLDKPARFGTGFKKPSAQKIRSAKHAGGSRMFEAAEIRQLLEAATPQMKAMILLGCNCAFGATDIANLPRKALDLAGGWVEYPRAKTGVPRRCPLWPETVQALKAAAVARPKPKSREHNHLAFITLFGRPWARYETSPLGRLYYVDTVADEFTKLLKRCKLKRRGSFYNLRHVFRTVADGSKDQPAIDSIMGHLDPSMAVHYRERIDDQRLIDVVEVVRKWLFEK